MGGKIEHRLAYIDIAKGILIILVVVGHVVTGSNFITKIMIRVINSFHMPAFFIITGMLTNSDKLRAQPFWLFVKKKAVRLLVPYVVFEFVGAVWQMILLQESRLVFTTVIRKILTVECYVSADWFLIALFFAEIILYGINKFADRKWYLPAAVVFLLLALYLPDGMWLLANCRKCFAAITFILLGIYWRTFFLRDSNLVFLLCTIGLVAGSALNSGTPSINLRLFENPFWFIVCGICGTYVVLFVSRKISAWGKFRKLFEQCGKASLVIMGTHQNVLLPFYIRYRTWTSVLDKTALMLLIFLTEIPLILLCKKYLPAWVSESKKDRF